jgi:SWI/SNF-related matrix-associated actin-dependent regulator 1 of chromatin subfamily A
MNLFPHQLQALDWSLNERKMGRQGVLLALEMGLGKTAIALTHASQIGGSAIAIVPNSLQLNWLEEAKRWAPSMPAQISRIPGEVVNGQIIIQPISIYRKKELRFPDLTSDQPLTIIIDESHALKDPKSLQSKSIRNLIREAKRVRKDVFVILLTGTPWTTSAGDLWAQVDAIGSLQRYERYLEWCRRFCWVRKIATPYGQIAKFEGVRNVKDLGERIASFTQRAKRAEIFPDLQKLPMMPVWVEVEKSLEKAIEDEICKIKSEDEEEVLLHFSTIRRLLGQAKIESAISWIKDFKDTGRQLVVFSWHREVAKKISEATNAVLVSGDVSEEDRQLAIKKFQSGDAQVIVLTIATGGLGLNLQNASDCLFVEQAWTPALMRQAEDRLCRIGQKSPVSISWMIADHELDRIVTKILQERSEDEETLWSEVDMARAVMEEIKRRSKNETQL